MAELSILSKSARKIMHLGNPVTPLRSVPGFHVDVLPLYAKSLKSAPCFADTNAEGVGGLVLI